MFRTFVIVAIGFLGLSACGRGPTRMPDESTADSPMGCKGTCERALPRGPQPMAHWPFDEGAGPGVRDASGNDHIGVVLGPRWAAGQWGFGAALRFDGVDDYVDVSPFGPSGNQLTVMAWFNADDFAVSDGRIISKAFGDTTEDHDFMLSTFAQDGIKVRARLSAGEKSVALVSNGPAIGAGQWHHVAMTYDGAALTLYQDGVAVGRTPMTGQVRDTARGTWIGRNPDGGLPFHGLIDDVRIYNVALSPMEVTDAMNEGSLVR